VAGHSWRVDITKPSEGSIELGEPIVFEGFDLSKEHSGQITDLPRPFFVPLRQGGIVCGPSALSKAQNFKSHIPPHLSELLPPGSRRGLTLKTLGKRYAEPDTDATSRYCAYDPIVETAGVHFGGAASVRNV